MKIQKVDKSFTQYFFFPKKDFGKKLGICKYCYAELDPSYVEIINKLKKNNILHEDHEDVCCYCFYKKKIVGFLKCPKCNTNLNTIDMYVSDPHRIIYCKKCDVIYKKIPL
ncbi:MAG: hypothetical protein ACTSQY_00455 [Candidatus Odinarchaeia archaeon]|nr:MAG: hypothetical protein [Lokiarchaeota virus Fenrir Meg22_1012]URC17272.1 MAG: hypothetical protein [Lokiarchaeota virus Fenrir Meg22_1214]